MAPLGGATSNRPDRPKILLSLTGGAAWRRHVFSPQLYLRSSLPSYLDFSSSFFLDRGKRGLSGFSLIFEVFEMACFPADFQLILNPLPFLLFFHQHSMRKLEDVNKKMEILNDCLRAGKLSSTALTGLAHILQCLQSGDYVTAVNLHANLSSQCSFLEVGSFLPAIKVLIQLAQRCPWLFLFSATAICTWRPLLR